MIIILRKEKSRISNEASIDLKSKKEDTRTKVKVRKLTWKENKELESIENDIMNAESEVEKIEGIFSSPDFYEKYTARTKELTSQLEQAKTLILKLYERWDELEKIKNNL